MWTKIPGPTSFVSSFPETEPTLASGDISTLVVDLFFTSIGPVEPNPSPGTITRNCLTESNQRNRNRPFASSFPVKRASARPCLVSPGCQTGITCTGRSASGSPSEPRTKTSTSPGSAYSTWSRPPCQVALTGFARAEFTVAQSDSGGWLNRACWSASTVQRPAPSASAQHLWTCWGPSPRPWPGGTRARNRP